MSVQGVNAVKAVLFDLDGTLLNTLEDIADSANYVLDAFGFPVHPTEDYRYFVGDGMRVLLARVLPADVSTSEMLDDIISAYSDHYSKHSLDKTRPYEGIIEMLSELKAQRGDDLKLAVISNKPDGNAKHTVEHFFGLDVFDYVVGGIEGVPLKPNPTMALRALEAIGAEPSEALFVGDTGIDMKTAKSVGCTSIGVTWGFRDADELKLNGADYLAGSAGELLRLIYEVSAARV